MNEQFEYKFGDAMSRTFGLPLYLIHSLQAHILTCIAGPETDFVLNDIKWPFQCSGMVISGNKPSVCSLVDMLLEPIINLQRTRMNARKPLQALIQNQDLVLRLDRSFSELRNIDPILADTNRRRKAINELSQLQLARNSVIHALLLLDSPEPGLIRSLALDSKSASPLWLDRNLSICDPNHKDTLHLIPWLAGHSQKPSKDGETKFSRIGYLGTLEMNQLSDLSDTTALSELQKVANFVLLKEDNKESPPLPIKGTGKDLIDEMEIWGKALEYAISLRDQESSFHYNLYYTDDQILHQRRNRIDYCSNVNLHFDAHLLNDLFPKILFGLTLLENSGADFSGKTFELAALIHNDLMREQDIAEKWLHEQSSASALDRDKERLIRALERRGPCTWPQLRRSLDVQRRDAHNDAINALIKSGKLTLDDDGVFTLSKKTQVA